MKLTKQFNRKEISISTLYIVPTPIGNLGDITQRAISVLSSVDIIAAEDTRRTKLLLKHFSIHASVVTLHNHNEHQKSEILLGKLKEGKKIALVSKAGTPLINDPGYCLVRLCHDEGILVVPLPGACAAITALSASGLPPNRFCYEGFLPTKSKARLDTLHRLNNETRTLIFYESTHRLINSLKDMVSVWGPKRYVVLARELTKIWESLYGAPVGTLLTWVLEDDNRCKGEIVLIIEGYKPNDKIMLPVEVLHTLTLLQKELSLKTAIALTAKIHSINRKILYKYTINEQAT